MATWEGRQRRPTLKVGICGEHGGDPRSIEFFEEVGLDYVSCSPFRVPVARLAGAHATLRHRTETRRSASTGESRKMPGDAAVGAGRAASMMP
jgi:pyruvate,orthophosphate dikinase